MDRDDMRDNIERATNNMWPKPQPDARPRSDHYQPPVMLTDGPHEVRAAYVDDQPVCAGCLEFGTICRPCRRERYEAALAARQLAERRDGRRRVRVALVGGAIVLLVLVVAQALLDRSCGVGRSWSSDTLACEVQR